MTPKEYVEVSAVESARWTPKEYIEVSAVESARWFVQLGNPTTWEQCRRRWEAELERAFGELRRVGF